MPLQDIIENSSLIIRRKLFDNQIELTGKKTKVIRIKLTTNKYGDSKTKVITKDSVECVLNYPAEIPLTRFRNNEGFTDEVESTNVFLFDIIPIDIYTKWGDNVEKYDFIIDRIKDENGNYITILLQVSENLGTMRTSILWKKGVCAPYSGAIPKQVQNAIDMLDLEK